MSHICAMMCSLRMYFQKSLIYLVNSYGSANQLHFKVPKTFEFHRICKNTFTIRFPISKSAITCEKVILAFFHPFDHCAVLPRKEGHRLLNIFYHHFSPFSPDLMIHFSPAKTFFWCHF